MKVCVTRGMFLEDSSSSGELSLCSWGGRKLRYWVGGAVDGAGRRGWRVGCGLLCPGPNPGGRGEEVLNTERLLPLFQAEVWQEPEVKRSQAAPGTSRSPSPQTPLREGPAVPVGTASASETCLTKVLGVPGSAPGRGVKAQPSLRAPSCPRENSLVGWDFAGAAAQVGFPLPGPASPLLSQVGSLINIVHTKLCFCILLQKPQQHPEREHRSGWPRPQGEGFLPHSASACDQAGDGEKGDET